MIRSQWQRWDWQQLKPIDIYLKFNWIEYLMAVSFPIIKSVNNIHILRPNDIPFNLACFWFIRFSGKSSFFFSLYFLHATYGYKYKMVEYIKRIVFFSFLVMDSVWGDVTWPSDQLYIVHDVHIPDCALY